MKSLIAGIILVLGLSGCTGVITGHEYTKSDFVVMYKVVRNGVTVFMSKEDIEKAKLDKVNLVVTDTYKLVKGDAQ